MPHSAQIFQTNNPTRWQRLKWGLRIIALIVVIVIVVITITLRSIATSESKIPLESRAIKKVLSGNIPAYRESEIGKKFRGFSKYISGQWAVGRGQGQNDTALNLSSSSLFNDSLGIRAAFYMNWDLQAHLSLKKNVSKLNLVIPEWFFIDPNADTLIVNIEKRDYDVIKRAQVQMMPMLSNSINTQPTTDAFRRVINDPIKREKLIADIIKTLAKFKFVGVNIDFDEVNPNKVALNAFKKSLYKQLHAQNFLVTEKIYPHVAYNDFTTENKTNDYFFLMAFDEHGESTKPGPICGQKWIEAVVDKFAKNIPPNKIILSLAAQGYDWGWDKRDTVKLLTYQQALVTARESDAVIDFDDDSYNLSYQYYDDKDSIHNVHFVDAATNFNTLRFSTEYGLAGTSLWRLGSEDNRIWDFYNLPMNRSALQKFNFSEFSKVTGSNAVDYIGEGEILDVLASPKDGHITVEVDKPSMLITEENYDVLPSTYVVKKFGKTNKPKLVLTYDDGPDPKYTKEILDTLAYYHVPATFFLIGLEAENNIPLVKRILKDGHEIGNHTFTHPDMSKVSKERALLEMDATQLLIEALTGRSTTMFRAPFNADSEPEKNEELVPVALSRTRNYITVGESLDPEDWQRGEVKDYTADTIFNRVVNSHAEHTRNGDSSTIILLHDGGGDRSQTVLATGMLIRYFESRGYTFTTVADLLGKKRDDVMPFVDGKDYFKLKINYFWAEAVYISSHFFFALFLVFMAMSAIRLLILGFLSFLQRKKERHIIYNELVDSYPLVSIIVPAYNEEVNVISSLTNLLKCDYPNYNIIFIDDGSKDATWQIVQNVFSGHPIIKLFTKVNGGKASALNFGIDKTSAAYVVCIDADTKLAPNAVHLMMKHFLMNPNPKEEIGAVAGVVKVGNEVNILTKWQNIEYITSQNFDRKGFAYANAITVVPGAIGAFKKQAIVDAGGFTTDTLAEDCDLTIRILRAGYIVTNEPKAVAYTEVPESLKQFMKQRYRWSFGVMQTFWKHTDQLFSSKNKSLGWIALPDILIFKYIVPLFSPIADVLMIFGLFTDNASKILWYYVLFTVIDAIIAAISFLFDKENPVKLIWLIPQRFIYRWLMLLVLYRSMRRALKGELQNWGVLKRTGNVKDIDFLDTVVNKP
ncbi:polysaccharide deacetylase family protein [Parasediminibacterium sp. JCM 36343]|uniref:polysaccharide deacetylase family protein n=1 Tax=Parasediminibacterium sp. JCM 36343 TaxID=3374279 RepID=UPI00397D9CB6